MQWEVLEQMEKPCPCGRGVIQTVQEINEMKKTREHTYLHCEYCTEDARERFRVAQKEEQQILLRLQVLRMELFSYFDSRYMEHWIEHFAFCPTKKAVWEILREHKIIQKSLTAFYEEVKNKSMASYLRNCATVGAMKQICDLLEIHDEYLAEKAALAVALAGKEHKYLVWSRD